MDIQFKEGTVEYLDCCMKAMENSTMCTSYFQPEKSRKNAVMDGINKGTLYVALCDGEWGRKEITGIYRRYAF